MWNWSVSLEDKINLIDAAGIESLIGDLFGIDLRPNCSKFLVADNCPILCPAPSRGSITQPDDFSIIVTDLRFTIAPYVVGLGKHAFKKICDIFYLRESYIFIGWRVIDHSGNNRFDSITMRWGQFLDKGL